MYRGYGWEERERLDYYGKAAIVMQLDTSKPPLL